MRLHREGRLRGWLGRRFGGDAELGERIWRRCLHVLGAGVLVYYIVPPGFFRVVPNPVALLLALLMVLLLDALRLRGHVELPTIRPFERSRLASFAYFAIGLVLAVLLFPEAIAVAVVLGTALVDPLIGELRLSESARRAYPSVPLLAYGAIAFGAFLGVGGWSWEASALAAGAAAALAVGVERLR
ncbi:MAG TPA: hypothetical protein VGS23_07245, partial [Thermoplasmata archaeon]|nr:hypothetical protein [Thermoplasmata archaeon]